MTALKGKYRLLVCRVDVPGAKPLVNRHDDLGHDVRGYTTALSDPLPDSITTVPAFTSSKLVRP